MSGPLYLGVDGGGTKTEFLIIDGAGAVVARAITGTTYHVQIGIDEAARRIGHGVSDVCALASIAPAALAFAFFGLPAYGEDKAADPQLDAICRAVLGHDRYRCDNDMVCGWAGSLACGDGINIVAGTGSIGYGQRRGAAARAGGWGEVFGDEGSAYWIAIRGLAAVSRMADGRLPKGPLYARLLADFGLDEPIELCERVMGPAPMTRDQIAALAATVAAAAEEDDAAASTILIDAAEELALLATTLRSRLGFAAAEKALVSWSGGVLVNQPLVRRRFVQALDAQGSFEVIEPRHGAGYGAALYARLLAADASYRR